MKDFLQKLSESLSSFSVRGARAQEYEYRVHDQRKNIELATPVVLQPVVYVFLRCQMHLEWLRELAPLFV